MVPCRLLSGGLAYRRDMANDYVPPNYPVDTNGGLFRRAVTVSAERTLLYDDDRPGLDVGACPIGSATVHWYGPSEAIARDFGDLAGDAADAAGDLLGAPWRTRSRSSCTTNGRHSSGRWDRAPASGWAQRRIRTCARCSCGSAPDRRHSSDHDRARSDARRLQRCEHEPFHEPASWLNEGIAVWSELGNAETEADLVRFEAGTSVGLMAFEAITGGSRSMAAALGLRTPRAPR